jgi:hypothetical protein
LPHAKSGILKRIRDLFKRFYFNSPWLFSAVITREGQNMYDHLNNEDLRDVYARPVQRKVYLKTDELIVSMSTAVTLPPQQNLSTGEGGWSLLINFGISYDMINGFEVGCV